MLRPQNVSAVVLMKVDLFGGYLLAKGIFRDIFVIKYMTAG